MIWEFLESFGVMIVSQNGNFESVVSNTQNKKCWQTKKLVQNSVGYNTRSRENSVYVFFDLADIN